MTRRQFQISTGSMNSFVKLDKLIAHIRIAMIYMSMIGFFIDPVKGEFTQSVIRGVIRRRLAHLKNKKWVFSKRSHFTWRILP